MIQVQMVISVDGDGAVELGLNVLAREDASEEERAIALAVEAAMANVMEQLARESGTTVEYIGPQHTEPS